MAEKAEMAPMLISPIGTSEQGFTLLELILVVALIGIFFGLAAPNWQGRREETTLRCAALQLAQLCRLGVSQGLRGEEVTLSYGEGEFLLAGEEGPQERYRHPSALSYVGPEELVFSSEPIEETLTLEGKQGSYIVEIAATGEVEIQGGSGA